MANIMQQLRLQNKPTKSGFDLSRSIKLTAKCGEATPFGPVKYVYPNVTKNLGVQGFTRTVNLNTAASARMREYYDFYFVPFEVLWNKFDSVVTQMKNNSQHATSLFADENEVLSLDMPYFTCQSVVIYLKNLMASEYSKNIFGFSRADCTVRLLSYLGYPDFSYYLSEDVTWEKYPMPNLRLSPFPLLAYQKVYADHIRYSQWEQSNPSTFNLDYIKGSDDLELDITDPKFCEDYNFFDLRYFNYNKDLFMGLLPNAQYGDTSIVNVSIDNSRINFDPTEAVPAAPNPVAIAGSGVQLYPGGQLMYQTSGSNYNTLSTATIQGANFSILALRQAEALQRWKEVSQSVDQDYKSQVEAHFGVSVSEYLAHKSTWLNGVYSNLDINPIVNNNLIGENGTDIKGIATMNSSGTFKFESKDRYGIIVALYHVTPIFDYCCGNTDPSVYLSHATDFPLPEFDRIGMEPIYGRDMCLIPKGIVGTDTTLAGPQNLSTGNKILGYAPRYIKWKTTVDIALGGFTKKEKNWILPFDLKALDAALTVYGGTAQITVLSQFISDSFKINPHVVDSIFSVEAQDGYDSDHFRVFAQYIDTNTQPLDYNGLPY